MSLLFYLLILGWGRENSWYQEIISFEHLLIYSRTVLKPTTICQVLRDLLEIQWKKDKAVLFCGAHGPVGEMDNKLTNPQTRKLHMCAWEKMKGSMIESKRCGESYSLQR